MNTKIKLILLFTAIILSGCGNKLQNSSGWTGGLIAIIQPSGTPRGIMILHQGHDTFDGARYGDDNLVPIANYFANAGLIVYEMEMPPLPHDSGPIEKYYDPALNLAHQLCGQGLPVYMSGLSGGGWTTTVVTALEPCIAAGFSISGDPVSSDWEQRNPPYDYPTLYVMAGNRLTHIYLPNGDGSSCAGFNGICVNDLTASHHEFTLWAANYILENIKLTP